MSRIHSSSLRSTLTRINARSLERTALVLIVYLALFVSLDWLSRSFQILPSVVIWYPPDGLSFALLLALGGAWWPAVALAALIGDLFIYQLAFPTPELVIWAVFISAIYGITAEFLRRRVRIDTQLHNLRDILWLICASGVVAAVLAVIAVSADIASGALQEVGRFDASIHWWIGETVGILAVVPVLLVYVMPRVRKFLEGRENVSLPEYPSLHLTVRSILKGLSLLVALYLAFGVQVLGQFQPLYLLALPLTWIAVQGGILGASLGLTAVSFGTAFALLAFQYPVAELGDLQLLMFVIGATSLFTGAVVTERRISRAALKESEERFRSLYENSTIGMYRTTPGGQILMANPSLVRMLGYSSFNELAQRDLEKTGYEPDSERDKFLQKIEKEGTVTGLESAWMKKDGTAIFVRESARAVRDAHGRTLYYEGTVEDITERHQAEQALQASLARYNHALDNMLEGCQVIDHDWRYIYINDAAARQGHSEPVQLLMHTMMEIYPGIEDTRMFSVLERCMLERVSDHIENEFAYPDGTTSWFELSIQPVPEGLFILSIDITDRKRAHTVLEQNEKRFRSLIENNADAITLMNAEGIAVYDSPAAPRMLGYEYGELVGQNAFELMHPDDLPRNLNLFRELAKTPGMRVESTFRLRHRDRRWLWIEAVATNLIAEPSVNAIVLNYRDVTQRKQAEEKIQQQLSHLNALRDIDTAIASTFGMDISLSTVLSHVVEQLHVDAAAIQLLNPISNTLSYAARRGFRTESIQRAEPLRVGQGYAGRVVLERRLVHISNPETQHESERLAKVVAGEDFVSYFGVPLVAKGKVNGVLEVFHRAPLEPGEDWLAFLDTLAGQAAIAIDNATLFEKLQQSNSELVMAYDATIEGWSHALDLRDEETEGHTQRVTEMTVKLARSFGLSEEELVQVRRGALLHDIGKMGVPDRILLKPGALTDEEWVMMRKHPQFAYDMLSPIRYLKGALDIPYCHHEKWDGTGYPRGMKGEQIPVAARIFAAVDIYDALTSDRPYRAAWSKEKTREYISSLSGTHLDPKVVEVFLKSDL